MSKVRHLRVGALSAFVLIAAVASAQDGQLGGNRGAGFGGAGLALPTGITQNFLMNPAFLGRARSGFSLAWPGVGVRLGGIDADEIRDLIDDGSDGNFNDDALISFGRRLARRPVDIGVDSNFGVRVGKIAVFALGRATISTRPNAALKQYDPGGLTEPPFGAQLDAYGVGYSGIGLALGENVKTKAGTLSVGVTAKAVKAYFAHKVVRWNGTATAPPVLNGSGLTDDTADESGFGADLGLLFTSDAQRNTHYGVTVENLIRPKTNFDRQLPDSAQFDRINPFKTQVNAGVGGLVGSRWSYGIDVLDIGNRAGRQQLAAGAEYELTKGILLRGGYNSRSRFTAGISLWGFNVAIADNLPLTVGTQVRF